MFYKKDKYENRRYNDPSAVDQQDRDGQSLEKSRRTQRIILILWSSFLGLGLLIFLVFVLIYNGVIGYMPPIEELEDPHDSFASILYASDGTTEIGRFYRDNANRENVEYSELSPYLVDALIATEDMRFEDHSGIDFFALGRTGVKTLMMGDKSSGGASTLTQQLAKLLYSDMHSRGFKRALQKPIEWMIAIKLERVYTKEEIIKMYLNRFDFLNNAVGIKTASNVYFNKQPQDLELHEAAMLVGILKNPSYFNPLRHQQRVLERRNTVFDQMQKAGKLPGFSKEQIDSLKALPLGLDYHKVVHKEGQASYLRDEIARLMTAKEPVRPRRMDYSSEYLYKLAMGRFNTDSTQWAEDPLYGWIAKNPKPDGSLYDIYEDGLKIYTTIDTTMQHYAEEAVYEHLGGYLQPAFFNEKRSTGPYTTNTAELSASKKAQLKEQAKQQTNRYRQMKAAGCSDAEIDRAFSTPVEMNVFAYVKRNGKWQPGSKTVTMSPMDSLMYMKSVLRVGMMCMDAQTGQVKAYVGGPDFTYFKYDMAGQGRRQIGSTAKPFLYTLAMEQDFDPCSTMLNTRPTYGNWSPRGSYSGAGGYITLKRALTQSNNWISARLTAELQPANLAEEMRLFGLSGLIEPNLPLCLGTNDVSVKEMVGAYSAFANGGVRTNPVFVTRIEDNKGNAIYTAAPHRTEVIGENAYYKIISMLFNVIDHGTGASLRSRYGISAQMGGKTGTTNYNADSWFMGFTPELVTGVWVGGDERYIHFNSMAFGQGARAALPIYGIFMRKVYANPKLPYKQDARFTFPSGFVECDSYSGGGGGGGGHEEEEEEEIVETALE